MAKRSWRRNIWGNVVGYEGGRRVEEFGCADYADLWAEKWAGGLDRGAAEMAALEERNPPALSAAARRALMARLTIIGEIASVRLQPGEDAVTLADEVKRVALVDEVEVYDQFGDRPVFLLGKLEG